MPDQRNYSEKMHQNDGGYFSNQMYEGHSGKEDIEYYQAKYKQMEQKHKRQDRRENQEERRPNPYDNDTYVNGGLIYKEPQRPRRPVSRYGSFNQF
jgi:hypothetical protein